MVLSSSKLNFLTKAFSYIQTDVKEGEEKLELKRGAFVQITHGKQTGQYGEVEGLDEETARYIC